MTQPTTPPPDETPLQGWKAIANYLERDERTARRWELEQNLPVRRHGKGGSVYAYASEIEAWRLSRPAPRSEANEERPQRSWLLPAAAAIGLVLAAGFALQTILAPPDPLASAAEGAAGITVRQFLTDELADSYTRLSADGKYLSFLDGSTGNLAFREINGGERRLITNKGTWEQDASFAETHAVSPGGKKAAYAWFNDAAERYEIRVVDMPLDGTFEEPIVLFEVSEESGYLEVAGWLAGGDVAFLHLAHDNTVRLLKANVETKQVSQLRSLDWAYPDSLAVSPDGQWLAYSVPAGPEVRQHDVFVLAADGLTETRLTEHAADDSVVAWTPDGRHLLFRSDRTRRDSLWAIPMAHGRAAGETRMVKEDLAVFSTVGVSPEGTLYYLARTGSRDLYEAEVDLRTGDLVAAPTQIPTGFVGDNREPTWSNDGRFLAYLSVRRMRNRERTLVIRDVVTGQEQDIDRSVNPLRFLAWSPDSSRLLFYGRNTRGRGGAFVVGPEAGEASLLFQPERASASNFGWMPDGKAVHYRNRSGLNAVHFVRNLETGDERELFSDEYSQISVSPDGASFAVVDAILGPQHVHKGASLSILDVRTGEKRELLQTSPEEGISRIPAWSPDGRTLVFWRWRKDGKGDQTLSTVNVETGEARPTKLTFPAVAGLFGVSLHPDGRRIVFSAGESRFEIWTLENFLSRLAATD